MALFLSTAAATGALLAAAPALAAEGADAVVVSKRQLPDAVAPIVLVTVRVPDLKPEQLFAVAWDLRTQAKWAPRIKRLEILKADANEWIIYEQVDIPATKDRDYVLRLQATARGEAGLYQIKAMAPRGYPWPLDAEHVRMTDLWSEWNFRPESTGGTLVSYESYGDPAGSLPGWLKRAAAERGPVDFVKALLAETRRRAHP
ncbi:MAG TPA: SRPBCC family protein [Pseudomonadota bacterium]|nr:SRPBCC family protein [Pseudomonadota bacterium]